ncbi:hypothetical protein LY632_07760 [Erythrobacter sp. SDW2]|uniref:hypothetical protein n=1 Tax=Erythrobacter sp. SDW2 TaxID=2907154 RepID=UPI001F19E956|nr:hypothetical protein [Erythrobacter sp. SDW2]UIP05614.1 hypothetical protein LY632_07760 [Erythrobacter sp. SDW2]
MQVPIVRAVLATLAGLVAAIATVGIVEMTGHTIFPPPGGLDVTNPADQARLMDVIPLGAKIAVVAAWFLGALAGCAVAAWLSRSIKPGWIVAGFLVLGGMYTTQMFPHPVWMVVCAVALPIVAKLLADRLLAARLSS